MAKPSYPRARRLEETIRRLAGGWLEYERADLQPGLVTVTDARVTPDLRRARVYFTVLAEEPDRSVTVEELVAATPALRSYVAHRVRLRYAPEIELVPDDLPDRAGRIDALLAELGTGREPATAEALVSDRPAGQAPPGDAPSSGVPPGQLPASPGGGTTLSGAAGGDEPPATDDEAAP